MIRQPPINQNEIPPRHTRTRARARARTRIVQEGAVGLYFRLGALTPHVSTPGFHYMIPWVTEMVQVSTSVTTEQIKVCVRAYVHVGVCVCQRECH